MKHKIHLSELTGDLKTYFNWSANALMPFHPGAADRFLTKYKDIVVKMARELIEPLNYTPAIIYRGVILRTPVTEIAPDIKMQYLSFSTDKNIAEHFADINGFGSEIVNLSQQLGDYGYVIEYMPAPEEILFHYELLSILPYAEAFTCMGMNGENEINGLLKQKEIMIQQPQQSLKNIKPFHPKTNKSFINI